MAKIFTMSNKIIIFSLVVIFIAIIYFMYQYAISSKYRISSEKAKELIRNNKIDLILDVRTNIERNTLGYYPGSIHIQSADLEKRMVNEYPNKNIRIIAYCNTGHRARMATEKLQSMGYKNATYISSTYRTLA
jgi:rhodanese-related sulfurtransferase